MAKVILYEVDRLACVEKSGERSFTGAQALRIGRFELADHGTLYSC